MIGHAGRVTLLAIIVALLVILAYQRILPNAPVTDDTYLLAGLLGVIVAGVADWLWARLAGQKKP